MGVTMVLMLVGSLILLAAIGAALYLGIRATRHRDDGELVQGEPARAVLDRRLATGEISTEDYYERESALRDAQRVTGRR